MPELPVREGDRPFSNTLHLCDGCLQRSENYKDIPDDAYPVNLLDTSLQNEEIGVTRIYRSVAGIRWIGSVVTWASPGTAQYI